MAQPGSATVWGTGGRKFKSCHPDNKEITTSFRSGYFVFYLYFALFPFLCPNSYHSDEIAQYLPKMCVFLSGGVRRNALRVLHPKSPHSEEMVQYIEWRTPCGYAAVWLQGSAVQGRHDRPSV